MVQPDLSAFEEWFVICRLELAKVNLCAKFKVSISTGYENVKEYKTIENI